MISEYYSEDINNWVTDWAVRFADVKTLISTSDCNFKHNRNLVVACLNVAGINKDDTDELSYIFNQSSDEQVEKFISKLGLKICSGASLYISDIKERLEHSPIALNIKFGPCGWIILIGIHCVGDSSKDTAVLYDMDLDKVFTWNLSSLLWMCNDETQMIIRR